MISKKLDGGFVNFFFEEDIVLFLNIYSKSDYCLIYLWISEVKKFGYLCKIKNNKVEEKLRI